MNPKALLDQYDIQPRKSLGQNFLHDPNALQKIIEIADLKVTDTVLEIGPGTGALTEYLAQAARKVIAVEVDERLKPILDTRLSAFPNVWVIYKDILAVNVPDLIKPDDFVVVANLPYYITSAILRQLLEAEHRPYRLVLMVQLEVAERIVAKPDDMSVLAVSVQFYGNPRIVTRLKPGVFWPRPDVDSAVVQIEAYEKPPLDISDEATFFKIVRAGFSQKRKQLKNALQNGLPLDKEASEDLLNRTGIDSRRRAETLTLEEWAALSRAFVGGS